MTVRQEDDTWLASNNWRIYLQISVDKPTGNVYLISTNGNIGIENPFSSYGHHRRNTMADEKENGTTEKKKAVELESIDLKIWPSATGDRATRALRVGDGKTKFDISAPIPENDVQAKKLYNVTLATLVRKGLVQLLYDTDSDARNLCKEAVEAKKLPDAGAIRKSFEEGFFTERTRAATGGQKAEVKAVKAAKEATGMSVEEMVLAVKRMKAIQAGVPPKDTAKQDAWIAANLK